MLLNVKSNRRGGSIITPLTPALKPSSRHKKKKDTETHLVKHDYKSPLQWRQWPQTDKLKPNVTTHKMEWRQAWKGFAVSFTTRDNLRVPRATDMWSLCYTQQGNDLFLKACLAVFSSHLGSLWVWLHLEILIFQGIKSTSRCALKEPGLKSYTFISQHELNNFIQT